ncbi:hypothetical protein CPLU01_13209 [Colletotrichum plurivorum]|uniref:Uncharacterized protein n=1 Tax=Colletotrichum plurivorum TaxID=2175906 RepID=A0A8H6JT48_9PEZI|nr:hypothetical protein CPLU01_13209 [Colletotrichum plurivorum]
MTMEIEKPETNVQESPASPSLPPRESDKTDETTVASRIPVSSAQPSDDTPTPTPEIRDSGVKDETNITKQQLEDEVAKIKRLEVDLRNRGAELHQKEKELLDVRRRWKQAAKELDKTKSSQQRGLHQKTDTEVKDEVTQLRWNIRNLAFGYFGGEPKIIVMPDDLTTEIWESLLSYLDNRLDVDFCLRSGTTRPFVIQSLIWDVIYTQIFQEALWAGLVSYDFVRLISRIVPAKPQDDSFNAEAWRKFCLWKAETASMIVNSSEATGKSESDRRHLDNQLAKISEDFVKSAGIFSSKDRPQEQDALRREMHNILKDAVKLDESMNRQALSFHWQFPRLASFNGEKMRLAEGVTVQENSLCLTDAPGLGKRGKSSGDGFESTELLLRGEVFPIATIEPKMPASRQNSERGWTYLSVHGWLL